MPTLTKKQAQFIIGLLFFCFVFGFAVSYGYIKLAASGKKPVVSTPKPTPTVKVYPADVTLDIPSGILEFTTASSFDVNINIDSKNQAVEAADFVVSFDPQYLKPIIITPEKFFGTYPVNRIEKDYIKLSGMATLVGNTVVISKGKGTVGTISFTSLDKSGETIISLDKEKTVVASGGENILGKTNSLSIRIGE